MELKMTGNMTVIQYASKFAELSRSAPNFVAFKRMKMRRFEEELDFTSELNLEGNRLRPIKSCTNELLK